MNLTVLLHYELPAEALAAWIEEQGTAIWWSVDGDPLLMERLDLPCPGDELAAEFRRIGKPLVLDAEGFAGRSHGQLITADDLSQLMEGLGTSPIPRDRVLHLSWKGSDQDWLLVEDPRTTESVRQEALAQQV